MCQELRKTTFGGRGAGCLCTAVGKIEGRPSNSVEVGHLVTPQSWFLDLMRVKLKVHGVQADREASLGGSQGVISSKAAGGLRF